MAKKELRGTKVCPKCEKRVGARLAQCECGYHFKPKAEANGDKAAPAKRRKAKRVKVDLTAPAADFGSTIQLIRECNTLTAALGGVDKAAIVVDQVSALVHKLGGVEALKKALKDAADPGLLVSQPVAVAVPAAAPVEAAAPAAPKASGKKSSTKKPSGGKKPEAAKAPVAAAKPDEGDEKPMPGEAPVAPAAVAAVA